MFKLAIISALFALAAAGHLQTYESVPVSGYEYEHSVQTQDYANHASVSAPLGGLVKSYSSPLVSAYHTAPVVKTYSSPIVTPVVKAYSSPIVNSYGTPLYKTYGTPLYKTYGAPLAHTYGVPTVYSSPSVHAW